MFKNSKEDIIEKEKGEYWTGAEARCRAALHPIRLSTR